MMARLAAVAATIAAVAVTACGEPPPHPRTVDMVKIERPIEQPASVRPAAIVTPAAVGFDPPPAPRNKNKPLTPPIAIVCDGA